MCKGCRKELIKVRKKRVFRGSGKCVLILSGCTDRCALEKLTGNSEFVVTPEAAWNAFRKVAGQLKTKRDYERKKQCSDDSSEDDLDTEEEE